MPKSYCGFPYPRPYTRATRVWKPALRRSRLWRAALRRFKIESMKITILLPEGNLAVGPIATVRAMFAEANDFLKKSEKDKPFFEVELSAFSMKQKRLEGQFSVWPETKLSDFREGDLLIIPPIFGDPNLFLPENQKLIDWLKEKRKSHQIEIAALCKGVFLLAATGILDGRTSTTHWVEAARFKKMFPEVKLQSEKVITDEDGIYTSGGASLAYNLILYLMEKFAGREVSIWVSKLFNINLDTDSQAPFIIFQSQKTHSDERISEVQEFMEKHFAEEITIKDLAEKFAFSNRNFIRRFQAAIGNTPIQYLQRIRIEAAKRLLETTEKSVSLVVFESGYRDLKTFRDIFKKLTGMTPKIYRDRYRR